MGNIENEKARGRRKLIASELLSIVNKVAKCNKNAEKFQIE